MQRAKKILTCTILIVIFLILGVKYTYGLSVTYNNCFDLDIGAYLGSWIDQNGVWAQNGYNSCVQGNNDTGYSSYIRQAYEAKFNSDARKIVVTSVSIYGGNQYSTDATVVRNFAASMAVDQNVKGVRSALMKCVSAGKVAYSSYLMTNNYDGSAYGGSSSAWESENTKLRAQYIHYQQLHKEKAGEAPKVKEVTLDGTDYVRIGPYKMSYGTAGLESAIMEGPKGTTSMKYKIKPLSKNELTGNFNQTRDANGTVFKISNKKFYIYVKRDKMIDILGGTSGTVTMKFKQRNFTFKSGRAFICDNNSGDQSSIWYATRDKTIAGREISYTIDVNIGDEISVTVNKKWDDGNSGKRPKSITVTLSGNGAPITKDGKTSITKTIKTTGSSANTYTFKNLNRYDKKGKAIKYSVTEDNVPDGYTVAYSPSSVTTTKNKSSYTLTIKNSSPDGGGGEPGSGELNVIKKGGNMTFRVWEDSKPQWIKTNPVETIEYVGRTKQNYTSDLNVSWEDKIAIDNGTKVGSYTYIYYTVSTEAKSEDITSTVEKERPATDKDGNVLKDKDGKVIMEKYNDTVTTTNYYTEYTYTKHTEKNNCVHKETHEWLGVFTTVNGKYQITGLYPGSYEVYETECDEYYDIELQSGYSEAGYHNVPKIRYAGTATLTEGSSETIKLGVGTSITVKNDKTRGDLEITKVNEEEENMDGIEIAIYGEINEGGKSYSGWLTGSDDYVGVKWASIGSIFTSSPVTYTTEDGKIIVTGLPVGKYSIYELKTKNIEYAIEGQGEYNGSQTLLGTVQVTKNMENTLEVTYIQTKRTKGNITINKTGVYVNKGATVTEKLGNVGFIISSTTADKGGWKNGQYVVLTENDDGDDIIDFTDDIDEATIFTTDENGQVSIEGLYTDLGPYKIEEVELEDSDPYYMDIIKMRGDTVVDLNGTSEITANIVDDRSSGDLTIEKVDENYEDLKLEGAEFKLKLVSGQYVDAPNLWLGWGFSYDGDTNTYSYEQAKHEQYLTNDISSAAVFKTDKNGKIEIKKIVNGTYEVYETKTPKGYNIERQEGYDPATKMVYRGTVTVSTNDNIVTYQVKNKKVVTTLDGKVWVDNKTGKLQDEYNSLYDGENSEDTLKEGITVNLIDKNTNTVKATTKTDKNGYYSFNYYSDGSDIIYWDLAHSYIEYIYNNKKVYKDEIRDKDKSEHNKEISEYGYITVNPFESGNEAIKNNSKAQAIEIKPDELDDRNLTGTEDPYPGRAVTLISDKELGFNEILAQKENANINEKLLTAYYDDESFNVNDINLGLVEKNRTEYLISEDIEYVKLVRGTYTFKYQYGKDAESDDETPYKQVVPTVQLQNTTRTFTQKIYPSDINYNYASENENNPNKFSVYVVYKINVQNLTNFATNEDYYIEQGLYLEKLTNDFDTSIYQLSNEKLAGDDEEIAKDFDKWSLTQGESGQVTFDIKSSDKKYKEGNAGIKYEEVESTYIQYKVTDEALAQIASKKEGDEDLKTRTIATSYGYHAYTRKDKNWKNTDTYNHRTITEKEYDSGLFLKWHLADPDRTISGKVFNDTKVEQLEGEKNKARENERLGNGMYDDGSEKTLKDVIVALINAENDSNNVANLYAGKLEKNQSTGKWQATTSSAITKVKDDGSYEFVGVVPGKYYLQFTYGDGIVSFKDLNGNTINDINEVRTKINGETETIRSNYYKSTIQTGPAKDQTNERSWFVGVLGKNYSVATDETGTFFDKDGNTVEENKANVNLIDYRTSATEELNNDSSKQKLVTNARTSLIDLQFEYKNVGPGEYPSESYAVVKQLPHNCSGMNFGIIERPYVKITLKSTIKNVKLTLSTGTTIINGDPRKQFVSKDLATLGYNVAKIETESSNLYGSTATIDYELTVKNESEEDYASKDYYKYGDKTGADVVETEVTKLINYQSYDEIKYVGQTDNLKDIKNDGIYDHDSKEDYYTDTALENNKKYTQKLLEVATSIKLKPKTAVSDEKDAEANYGITVSRLLSNSMNDLGWKSFTEIIGIKNISFTPQSALESGNYHVGDLDGEDGTTSQEDNDLSTLIVSTPTGENRSITIYIIAGGILIIIAGGIILIKKFVI